MRSVSVRLADLCKITIPIGFVGENLHTQVKIDCMKLFEEYPDAYATMTVKPADGDAYPAVITREGDFVIWDITDSDLVHQGIGEFQLSFVVGEVVAKSYIGKIRVDRSIIPTGDIPDPVENWIGQATELLEEIEDAFPEGGTKGQVLAKASEEDFDTEWVDLIDDNAGDGDTDKTWSADKLTSEFDGKANDENAAISGSLKVGENVTVVEDANTVAFGKLTNAIGDNSFASGSGSSARGFASAAFGSGTRVNDDVSSSAAFGAGTIANGAYQVVFGRYNAVDWGEPKSDGRRNYVEVVGNGSSANSRMTARTLDWNGNERLKGDLYVHSNVDGSGGTKVATVDELPVIDDNAGAGVTDKTWSADKSTTELNGKANIANPVFTGTDFSFNRKPGTEKGYSGSATFGWQCEASGSSSFAEGNNTSAKGNYSHSEGLNTSAQKTASHAEGQGAWATGESSHAENYFTLASGNYSHAEGYYTESKGYYQHVSGKANVVDNENKYAEIVGNGTLVDRSNARALDWEGNERIAGDLYVGCNPDSTGGKKVITEDDLPDPTDLIDDTAGVGTTDKTWSANKILTSLNAKAGIVSPSFSRNISMGRKSGTSLGNVGSVAIGNNVEASGASSFACGSGTKATGSASFAEGQNTEASSQESHAEGLGTKATNIACHAEGAYAEANGYYSHAQGFLTIANGMNQTALGKCNVADNNDEYIEIVGNGTSDFNRSNARSLDWNGNERLKGDLYVGCNADSTGGTKVATINDLPTIATTAETQEIITEYGVSA